MGCLQHTGHVFRHVGEGGGEVFTLAVLPEQYAQGTFFENNVALYQG